MTVRAGCALLAAVILAACGDPNAHQHAADQADLDAITASRTMVANGGSSAEQEPMPGPSPAAAVPAPAVTVRPAAPAQSETSAAPTATPAADGDWAGDWSADPARCGGGAWRVAAAPAEAVSGGSACEIGAATVGSAGALSFRLECSASDMSRDERWSLRHLSPERLELTRQSKGRIVRETLGRCA